MTRSAPPRPVLRTVVTAGVATLAMLGFAAPVRAQDPPRPDPYTEELPAFGPSMVGVSTGVPIFFGQAGPTAPGTEDTPVQIENEQDFQDLISSPGPALAAGVEQFYLQGGGPAYVLPTAGDDAASLTLAVSSEQARVPGVELAVVPALGSLSGPAYLTVAQALGQLAVELTGTALLDTPTAMTTAAAQDPTTGVPELLALANQVRATVPDPARVALYAAALTDPATGASVSTAATMAGVYDQTDAMSGIWVAPGGLAHVLQGVDATFMPADAQMGPLNIDGVNCFRTVPGYGTVPWGARTLSVQPSSVYVSAQRTLSYIQRTVTAGLQPFVFAANDPTTWSQVTADVSGFLTELWQSGGLLGSTASQAFTVDVGIPTSMTSQDVLDGQLVVDIQVAITEPSVMTPLTLTQQLQS